MGFLQVESVSKLHSDRILIDAISFQQEAGQKIAITGESGAGKSTLLKIISGHVQPDGGQVIFSGTRVKGPDEQLYPGHDKIAYLSQHYELLNNYYVKDLIWHRIQMEEAEATTLFRICRIDHLLERKTNQISGGEKQRIALCMLLVKHPKMLVLDEPFSNLDPIHASILKQVLEDVNKKLHITCLMASHNPLDTLSWADKIIVIRKGRIVQQGTPVEIYFQPNDKYIAGMFGKFNIVKNSLLTKLGFEITEPEIILRPEDFLITTNGVPAKIIETTFWGGHYEVLLEMCDGEITVRTNNIHKTGISDITVHFSESGAKKLKQYKKATV